MKKAFIFLLAVLMVFGCNTASKNTGAGNHNRLHSTKVDSVILSERDLLKEYALCKCILHGYSKYGVAEGESSPSIYFDISLYNVDSKHLIDSISKSVADSIVAPEFGDYKGLRPVISNCMLFYKSKYLDSIIKTLDSTIVR